MGLERLQEKMEKVMRGQVVGSSEGQEREPPRTSLGEPSIAMSIAAQEGDLEETGLVVWK